MLYIGPHVSISGGISLATDRARLLNATGFAIFTKNQRIWKCPPLSKDDAAAFRKSLAEYGFSPSSILPHAGYLINPATPDSELRKKSLDLMADEAVRMMELGLSTINIHPGAYKEGSREDGMKRSAAFFDEILTSFPELRIAIENTSGSGTILGSRFEELAEILDNAEHKDRIGFTLDTAHLFGAGYDVKSDPDKVLDAFMSLFGEEKLMGMHLNDSKVPLDSKKDRHESIGKGLIGLDAFKAIVRRSEVQDRPLILETPDESAWKDEIDELLGR